MLTVGPAAPVAPAAPAPTAEGDGLLEGAAGRVGAAAPPPVPTVALGVDALELEPLDEPLQPAGPSNTSRATIVIAQ
ncbi:MAG TPA: hypothetical protein VGQ62_19370 [Chloroflexota bacterium]|nr:hypothetical protein [Chloroflexota bacterium]